LRHGFRIGRPDGLGHRAGGVVGEAAGGRGTPGGGGGEHRQDARLPPARLPGRGGRLRLHRHSSGPSDRWRARVKIAYEISHLLAGIMLVASFALLYQQRIGAVLNAFAAQSITLALAVGWAAWSENRPDLFITAAIAFSLKGVIIPLAL